MMVKLRSSVGQVIVVLCTIGLVSPNPISHWSEYLSPADSSIEEADTFHDKIKDELEKEAVRQVALATRLEEAAARTARQARELQERAEAAKLHALEAVEQEQAVMERERSVRAAAAAAREQERRFESTRRNLIDPLMDEGTQPVRKRSPDPEVLNDADMLEALRLLYLQELLTNRRTQADPADLHNPSERVIFVPPDDTLDGRNQDLDDEALAKFKKLLLYNNLNDPTDHELLRERLLSSALEGTY